jgi:hypothetical protein
MMKTGVRVAALTLLALTLSWSTAQAGDFCITAAATFQIVGKSFKVPPHGKCKPFFGFFSTSPGSATTGQACTATNGSHVEFGLTTTDSGSPGFTQWDNIDLSLPALTGTLASTGAVSGTLTSASSAVTGAPCPAPVPIP